MKQLKNMPGLHSLILDEYPFKVYTCKMTGNSILKHLAFTDANGDRYYNGEGNFTFTCYFPYAKSRFPYIEDYNHMNIPEWNDINTLDAILTLEGYQLSKISPKGMITYQDSDSNYPFNINGTIHTERHAFEDSLETENSISSMEVSSIINRAANEDYSSFYKMWFPSR